MTLVDTNVLLDVFTEDSKWLGWSLARLKEAAFQGPPFINDVIYAEASTRYPLSRILKPRWLPPVSRLRRYPGWACFWPARPSCDIERRVEFAPARSLTFLLALLARTRRSNNCRC